MPRYRKSRERMPGKTLLDETPDGTRPAKTLAAKTLAARTLTARTLALSERPLPDPAPGPARIPDLSGIRKPADLAKLARVEPNRRFMATAHYRLPDICDHAPCRRAMRCRIENAPCLERHGCWYEDDAGEIYRTLNDPFEKGPPAEKGGGRARRARRRSAPADDRPLTSRHGRKPASRPADF